MMIELCGTTLPKGRHILNQYLLYLWGVRGHLPLTNNPLNRATLMHMSTLRNFACILGLSSLTKTRND